MSCHKCGSTKTTYLTKIISTGRTHHYPKFIPQIKETCTDCGTFKDFATQEYWLIDWLNSELQKIELHDSTLRDGLMVTHGDGFKAKSEANGTQDNLKNSSQKNLFEGR